MAILTLLSATRRCQGLFRVIAICQEFAIDALSTEIRDLLARRDASETLS
jgi:hypothetical protein